MSKINSAIKEIHTMDYMASRNQWLNNIHPLVKLSITILYIGLVVSFDKYDLLGLAAMFVYPFFIFQAGDISFKEALHRLRVVIPVVCVVGIFNPFFDTKILLTVAGVGVRAGVVSMLTLMLKGIMTVLASYLLIASTTIEGICYAMRVIHLPKIFVTEIMLIYRYITLLLTEAHRMTEAYKLRAPGQKGVAYKVWGSLVGQLLLRSVDRAEDVYQAMNLRGYNGEFYTKKLGIKGADIFHLVVWIVVLLVFRTFPVVVIIGNLFV